MKIVFFTNKCSHGAALLEQLKNKDVPLEAIFIEESRRSRKKLRKIIKREGLFGSLRLATRKLKKVFGHRDDKSWLKNEFYPAFAKKVNVVDNFNGEQCERLLLEIEPDIIILGGSRIIRDNIIRIPKAGILNAHPGLLPEYRGIDVIPWAVYNGDNAGVTIHFVDAGIDTGNTVAQKVIEIETGDTIDSLRKKAETIAGELMSEVVLKIISGEDVSRLPQPSGRGKLYRKMPEKLLRETEKKLRERQHE
ncbi:hypothetical protein JXI42_14585 [bacterium]|nr:hypothetical protein [bacterium]